MEFIKTPDPEEEAQLSLPTDEECVRDTAQDEPIEEAEKEEDECEDLDTPPDILESDREELMAEFPELSALGDIADMEGAIRYGELRELGLTPREAYLATRKRQAGTPCAKAHLTPAAPHSPRHSGISMPRAELKIAREIFVGLSDREIEALYKKVTRT